MCWWLTKCRCSARGTWRDWRPRRGRRAAVCLGGLRTIPHFIAAAVSTAAAFLGVFRSFSPAILCSSKLSNQRIPWRSGEVRGPVAFYQPSLFSPRHFLQEAVSAPRLLHPSKKLRKETRTAAPARRVTHKLRLVCSAAVIRRRRAAGSSMCD